MRLGDPSTNDCSPPSRRRQHQTRAVAWKQAVRWRRMWYKTLILTQGQIHGNSDTWEAAAGNWCLIVLHWPVGQWIVLKVLPSFFNKETMLDFPVDLWPSETRTQTHISTGRAMQRTPALLPCSPVWSQRGWAAICLSKWPKGIRPLLQHIGQRNRWKRRKPD